MAEFAGHRLERLANRIKHVESRATPWAHQPQLHLSRWLLPGRETNAIGRTQLAELYRSAALWIGDLGGTNPQPILQESKRDIITNKLFIIGAPNAQSSMRLGNILGFWFDWPLGAPSQPPLVLTWARKAIARRFRPEANVAPGIAPQAKMPAVRAGRGSSGAAL
jgi:hypothetical protein